MLDETETRQDNIPSSGGLKDKTLDGRKTVLDESFWADFALLARVCYMHDPEATIYDVFDTMRKHLLGGWEFSESLIARVDAEIEEEYQDELRRSATV